MKKITKIMAFLTAITMSVVVMSMIAYAKESIANCTENNLSIDITAIKDSIDEFFEKNGIKNQVDANWGLTGNSKGIFIEYLYTKTKTDIVKFIEDKNYDPSLFRLINGTNFGSDKIAEKINAYADQNDLNVFAYAIHEFDQEKSEWSGKTNVYYYSENQNVRPIIEAYVANNIYDPDMVIYEEGKPSDNTERITDIFEITKLLSTFIKDNGFEDCVSIIADNLYDEYTLKVCVLINDYITKQDTKDAIKKYIKDKNIDESIVVFMKAESPNTTSIKLQGDANLDGRVDLADLTVVAKYNLSNEAYPLANEIAYANADMNDDGKVDGLDTSALIENQLGK